MGWRVLRIWSHTLASAEAVASRITSALDTAPRRRYHPIRQK
jgi:very-short-patch-repair endonuclease